MPTRAIIFDLDDTLIVDEAISREAMQATAALAFRQHGADSVTFRADAARLGAAIWREGPLRERCAALGITMEECLWGHFKTDAPLRDWALAARVRLFDAVLRAQEIEDGSAAAELSAEFSSARRKLQRLMPDAAETLARLKPVFKLGLLTNGDSSLQREKIAACGLAPFFDFTVVSGEFGIGKPRPEIFHAILDGLEVDAAHAAMVGNSLERDILGARNAGLATGIWLQVPGSEEFADVTPDHTITGLHGLPKLLEPVLV